MPRESKEDRFKRIAEKRVQRVIDSLRSLAQASNPRMYAWNQGQLSRIWAAIDQELKACQASFEQSEKTQFKL